MWAGRYSGGHEVIIKSFLDTIKTSFPISVKFLGRSQDASVNTMDGLMLEHDSVRDIRCFPVSQEVPGVLTTEPEVQSPDATILQNMLGAMPTDSKPTRFRRSSDDNELNTQQFEDVLPRKLRVVNRYYVTV